MNSIQTKAKAFVHSGPKCIAQIAAVAEPGGFRIYVAWEWENMAKAGIYGITKSNDLYLTVTPEAINETADFGWDISETPEAKRVMSNLFKS